ncbi:uncharacterized protein LOC142165505 [Nicotiana tabacum]|uniref:Uncharacterized protein LOC142165505 n=1 Tax=Nicotiana tabacum TaxID=4097 RepID=A0AC58S589_TOBAC
MAFNPNRGHSGLDATTRKVLTYFYWKSIRKDIVTFILNCTTCQRNKYDTSASPGLLQPLPIPPLPWTDITMDFIEGLPRSKDWSSLLPLAEWWYNSTPHSSVKTSPFELLYGYPPLLHLPFLPGDTDFSSVEDILLSTLAGSPYHKLISRYFGPYPIVEKIGVVSYKLLLPPEVLIHPTFHISHHKIFHSLPLEIIHPHVFDLSSHLCPVPEAILARRLIKRGNKVVAQ